MKIQTKISSLSETQALATAFAKMLQPPMIVLLTGDLGSGKTTFVKSVVSALGSTDLVTSPTFTLLNTYQTQKFPVYHFDMYRLEGAEEARASGFEEYFDKSTLNGVVFVEWPENVEGLIENPDFVIEFEKTPDDKRIVTIVEGKK